MKYLKSQRKTRDFERFFVAPLTTKCSRKSTYFKVTRCRLHRPVYTMEFAKQRFPRRSLFEDRFLLF